MSQPSTARGRRGHHHHPRGGNHAHRRDFDIDSVPSLAPSLLPSPVAPFWPLASPSAVKYILVIPLGFCEFGSGYLIPSVYLTARDIQAFEFASKCGINIAPPLYDPAITVTAELYEQDPQCEEVLRKTELARQKNSGLVVMREAFISHLPRTSEEAQQNVADFEHATKLITGYGAYHIFLSDLTGVYVDRVFCWQYI